MASQSTWFPRRRAICALEPGPPGIDISSAHSPDDGRTDSCTALVRVSPLAPVQTFARCSVRLRCWPTRGVYIRARHVQYRFLPTCGAAIGLRRFVYMCAAGEGDRKRKNRGGGAAVDGMELRRYVTGESKSTAFRRGLGRAAAGDRCGWRMGGCDGRWRMAEGQPLRMAGRCGHSYSEAEKGGHIARGLDATTSATNGICSGCDSSCDS